MDKYYNPIDRMIQEYVKNRMAGDIEERSFIFALCKVQREIISYGYKGTAIRAFLTMTEEERTLGSMLEIEYAKARMEARAAAH